MRAGISFIHFGPYCVLVCYTHFLTRPLRILPRAVAQKQGLALQLQQFINVPLPLACISRCYRSNFSGHLTLFTISYQLVCFIVLPYGKFLSRQGKSVSNCSSPFHIVNLFGSNYLRVSQEENCCSIPCTVNQMRPCIWHNCSCLLSAQEPE